MRVKVIEKKEKKDDGEVVERVGQWRQKVE